MKNVTDLSIVFFCLLAVILSACSTTASFKGHTYKVNKEASIKEAMKASLTETSPPEGLEILRDWIGYIDTVSTMTPALKQPIESHAHRYIGDAYTAQSNFTEAWFHYNRSIALEGNNIYARCNRAGLYANNLLEYDWAREELNILLRKKPYFADAYFAIGQTYDEQRRYKEAIAYYNKAIALDDSAEHYKANKQGTYGRFYQTENVKEDAEEFVRKYPQDIEAYKLRGTYYHMDGEYEKALADYTKIIYLNKGKEAVYYSNRAYIYAALGKHKPAIKDFTTGIRLQKTYTGILYASRGNEYAEIGQDEKALADYMTGVENAEGSPVPYTMRGDYYMTIGRYAEAVDDYTAAINIYALSHYYEKRAEAYREMGNEEKAKEDDEYAKMAR